MRCVILAVGPRHDDMYFQRYNAAVADVDTTGKSKVQSHNSLDSVVDPARGQDAW